MVIAMRNPPMESLTDEVCVSSGSLYFTLLLIRSQKTNAAIVPLMSIVHSTGRSTHTHTHIQEHIDFPLILVSLFPVLPCVLFPQFSHTFFVPPCSTAPNLGHTWTVGDECRNPDAGERELLLFFSSQTE